MMKKTIFLIVLALFFQNMLKAQPDSSYNAAKHQKNAMNVLLTWGVGSALVGAGKMALSTTPYGKAFALQTMVWGGIDAGIAGYGKYSLNKKLLNGSFVPAQERKDFRKVLLINALIDVGYVGLGVALMRAKNDKWHGHGMGIATQGAFLVLFDGLNFAITF